jgi:adenylate cyclase
MAVESKDEVRRLATIMFTDMVGYSALVQKNEALALALLDEQRAILRAAFAEHGGREIEAVGDGFFVEFPSALSAARCAVAIQQTLAERNSTASSSPPIQVRIGLHVGDVVARDNRIHGDAVNIAARIEPLAPPGGICVSEDVARQIQNKLDLLLVKLGKGELKNIQLPVSIFRLVPPGEHARLPLLERATFTLRRRRVRQAASVGILLLVVASGAWLWQRRGAVPDQPDPLSIAVLPFANLSGDPGQEYFADGMTEDIITQLSRVRELRVMARNTTFLYKGKPVDIPAVGKTLRVRYVLEGSVQRSRDRVRITAQLVDAVSGSHLWAERYDRQPQELFALQDEVAGRIVATIAGGFGGVLQMAASSEAAQKDPGLVQAHDYVLRATDLWLKGGGRAEAHSEAEALFEKAIAIAPEYARARQQYAWFKLVDWIVRVDPSPKPPRVIKENAIRAAALDPADALAHRTAAFGYFFDKQLDLSAREFAIALDLSPNNAEILAEAGLTVGFTGEWKRGVQMVTQANALNPRSAEGWYHTTLYYALYLDGRYEEAISVIKGHPAQWMAETQMKYVMAYGQLGNVTKAREYWTKCVELEPDWSARKFGEIARLWNLREADIEKFMEGVAKAGYPT